jgi:ubiquinone/menaquinone biosynthesis C-methylase UbiE
MKNAQTILQEAHRVLRPGGKVLVVEFPRNSLAQKLWNENYYTIKELTGSLRKAGFKDILAKRIEHKQILWVTGFRSKN